MRVICLRERPRRAPGGRRQGFRLSDSEVKEGFQAPLRTTLVPGLFDIVLQVAMEFLAAGVGGAAPGVKSR